MTQTAISHIYPSLSEVLEELYRQQQAEREALLANADIYRRVAEYLNSKPIDNEIGCHYSSSGLSLVITGTPNDLHADYDKIVSHIFHDLFERLDSTPTFYRSDMGTMRTHFYIDGFPITISVTLPSSGTRSLAVERGERTYTCPYYRIHDRATILPVDWHKTTSDGMVEPAEPYDPY